MGARADNVWRLPTIGEALALTEDSFAVAATTALPLGFETGLTLFLATGDNAVSEATRAELRTDGIYADLYVEGEGGEMNAAVNAHDFSARTGRIACVSPVYPEVYAAPATPAGLRWEDEDGDAFEGPVSRSVSQLASPTVVFLAARARAYRLTRAGEVLVSLTGRVSVDVRTTLGGTFYDFDSAAGVVRLSGEPGAAELFAAQEYNGFYGAAISLSVSAGRSARVYFGGQLMGANGFRFTVTGVRGENGADVGPIAVTAAYHGRVRGMHVVRSELGERFVPHSDNGLDFEVHFGPYEGDAETGRPLRPIGYQESFCEAGNVGTGSGWRAASLAELAAVQIEGESYQFRHESVIVAREAIEILQDVAEYVTVVSGVEVTVASTTLTATLGAAGADFTYLHTLAARTDIASGTHNIRLGPLDPGDRLLPNIFALPSDVRVNVSPDRGSGERDAELDFSPAAGAYRPPMAFVARHRLPQNYQGAGYFRSGSDSDGEGYVDGAVYVCVKSIEEGGGAREKLPLAGRLRVEEREINISPPFARVLARNTVEIFYRNEQWEEIPHFQSPQISMVNNPDNVALETELLPDGKTRVDVVLLDENEPPPQVVTVAAESVGDREEFVVRQGARPVIVDADLTFNGTRLTQSGQKFIVPNVEGVFQCGLYIGECGNHLNDKHLHRDWDWWWRWRKYQEIEGQPDLRITATYMGRRRGLHFVRSPTEIGHTYYRAIQSTGRYRVPFSPEGGYTRGLAGGFRFDGVKGGHDGNFNLVGLDGYQDDFCKKGGADWRMPTALEIAGLSTDEDEIVMHVPHVTGFRLWHEREEASLRSRDPGDFSAIRPPIMAYSEDYWPSFATNKVGNKELTIPWIAQLFALNAGTYPADGGEPWGEPSSQAVYGTPAVYICVKEVEGYDEPRPSRAWFGGARRLWRDWNTGTQLWVPNNGNFDYLISPFKNEVVVTAGAHRFSRLAQTVLLDEEVSFNLIDPPAGFSINARKIPNNPDGLYEVVIEIPDSFPDSLSTLTLDAKPEIGIRGRLLMSVSRDVYFSDTRVSDIDGGNPKGQVPFVVRNVPIEHSGGQTNIQAGYIEHGRGLQVVFSTDTLVRRPFTGKNGHRFNPWAGGSPPGTGLAFCEAGNRHLPKLGWRLASLMEYIAINTPASRTLVTVRRENSPGYAGLLRDGEWAVRLPPGPSTFSDTHAWVAVSDLPTNYKVEGVVTRWPGTPIAQAVLASGDEVRALETIVPLQNLKEYHNGPVGRLGTHIFFCVRDIDPDNPVNLPLAGNAEGPNQIISVGPFSGVVAELTVSVVGRDNRWNPILRTTPVAITFAGEVPSHFSLTTRTLPGPVTEVQVISSDPNRVADTSELTVRASPSFGGHKDITLKLVPDDGLYFGNRRLSENGGFRVLNVEGSHSSDTNVNARLTVSATYRGEIRGMHVVYSDLGSARTGRGSRTGYSYHSGPSGADGYRDGYQNNFCASGNTGSGFGWRAASLAELAAVQLSASVVTLRDAAGAPDNRNNLAAGDYVLHLGNVGEGEAALLPNLHSGPSDLFLNAAYTTGPRSGVINYNASGVGFRPSYGVVPFQLQADERNGAFLRNNTIEDFVYVCVKDVAGGVRPDLPLAGNAEGGSLVTVASPLSRVLTRAVVSVTGRDRNWNSVLRDEDVAVSIVGVGGDYLGSETTRFPSGARVIRIVITGTIAAADAAATVFAAVRPRLGGATTLELRFAGDNWREELSVLGAEAARLAEERARASRTEFDGEVLVLGDSVTREVVFAGSLLRMSVQYRGRRRGLYFATAEPESELPNWHQARDDVCAAGGGELARREFYRGAWRRAEREGCVGGKY